MNRDGSVSPMMSQYLEIKEEHEGALLFYRMGDFYEMFFDDAVAASEALGIALTKRGRTKGGDIPMCGVPVHSASGYLNQLIKKGFRVAVCEQTEDPAEARKRGSTAVVAREVVRVITARNSDRRDAAGCSASQLFGGGFHRAGTSRPWHGRIFPPAR